MSNAAIIASALDAISAAESSLQEARQLLDGIQLTQAGFADVVFDDWVRPESYKPTSETNQDGAFRFFANVAKFGRFDPIVYPGQDNVGHLHMFWGNTEINPHSTHESLTQSGHSTGQGDMINRSAYWTPALLFADTAWVPDFINNYYKMPDTRRATNPWPDTAARQVGMPAGIKMVFGNPMNVKTWAEIKYAERVKYLIDSPELTTSSSNPADILPLLKPGQKFSVMVWSDNLWNGELDSPDHRSHLATAKYNIKTSKYEAPATHPYMIPQTTFIVSYTVPGGVDLTTLRCSSDMPGVQPLLNFHADYMEAWHPTASKMWFENAILRRLSCSHCDFGNGFAGKEPVGFKMTASPNLIPMDHAATGHIH